MNASKKRKHEENGEYECLKISNKQLKDNDITFVGITKLNEAKKWSDEPMKFEVVGWTDDALPQIKFDEQTATCTKFDQGVYCVDGVLRANGYGEFNRIQLLEIKPDSEDDIEHVIITIIPCQPGGVVRPSQFLTWNIDIDEEWPEELQFIQKAIQAAFVIAPPHLTTHQVCQLLKDFAGSPLHPHDGKIGTQVFVFCQDQ